MITPTTSESRGELRASQRRALWVALIANGSFVAVELVAAIALGSLALLADAVHMISDVVGLAIALVAHGLVTRPATTRHSFGFQRAEVLGAQANGILLLASAVWIAVEAVQRIGDPTEVAGSGVIVVAALGLTVNVGSAVVLARAQGASLNMRGAVLHMVADAGGSVAAAGAGVAIVVWGANWADPAASALIGALILRSGWRLLRDTAHVLLEGAPKGIDGAEVEAALAAVSGVESVHHLHLWNLASDVPSLSAHVVLAEGPSLHDAQVRAEELRALLDERFGIAHATLELECHACEPEPGQDSQPEARSGPCP